MKWHYVDQGQKSGPVSDAELSKLHQEGKITADTLVWCSGLENWIPFREAKLEITEVAAPPPAAPPLAASIPNPNEAICAECGKIFPTEETIRYGNAHVCAACKPIFLQKLAEGAKVNTGEFEYAGFWVRFAAKLVDGLILGGPFGVLMVIMAIQGPSTTPSEPPVLVSFMPFFQIGMIFINLAYQTFFVGKYGATPGKMLCKLKIVTAEGARLGYGRAAGRALAEILSGMICYIGYIMVGFDGQKRALHDHICNTRVIHKDK